MRIIIDAANIDTGGAFKQLVGFARHAASAGHQVEICCISAQRYAMALAGTAVEVSTPGGLARAAEWASRQPRLVASLVRLACTAHWRSSELPDYLRQRNADVLFNPNAILPARRVPGCAYVVMSQNMLPFDGLARRSLAMVPDRAKLMLIRRSQIQGLERADGVVFISDHAAQVISKQVPALRGNTCVNYLGVDDDIFHPNIACAPAASAPMRIVYVSTLLGYKHHFQVVSALAELRKRSVPAFELHLIGSDWQGERARLVALANRLEVGERVRFWGELSEAEVAIAMREADIGLFASSCENCPTTLIEKMKSGLPIACSKLGPMSDILGDAGVYFDPRRTTEIVEALHQLLTEPSLRDRLRATAMERARRYSPVRHNGSLLEFMSRVSAGKRNTFAPATS
jgi:glycosyltransferase involved in cell wall biosynthesis